ncbi:MAG: hypothetical protein ABII00_09620 [Elusimicrobiota bacterium]
MLRKTLAYGLWSGSFAGATLLIVNAGRFSYLPGFVARSAVIGAVCVLAFGVLGYLFHAGIILKD